MPEIDLEPHEFRGQSRKGEPFFHPEFLPRLARALIFGAVFVACLIWGTLTYWLVYDVSRPASEAAYCEITSNC